MDDDYVKFFDQLEPLINRDLNLSALESVEYLEFLSEFCEEQFVFEKLKSHILLEFAYSKDQVNIKRQWIIDAVIDNQFGASVKIAPASSALASTYRVISVNNDKNVEVWVPLIEK